MAKELSSHRLNGLQLVKFVKTSEHVDYDVLDSIKSGSKSRVFDVLPNLLSTWLFSSFEK